MTMERWLVIGCVLIACSRNSVDSRSSQGVGQSSEVTATANAGALASRSSVAPASPPPGVLDRSDAAERDRVGRYRFPQPARLVAIGDLHGDIEATRAVLQLAGALGEDDHWAGRDLVVVQTGDQLDRGDGETEIQSLLERLAREAAYAGGALHVLNGNHETMNVAGDFRYVTEAGFDAFSKVDPSRLPAAVVKQVPAKALGRAAAFLPGGPAALVMANHPAVLVVGDTAFAHGGILPEHVEYGVERLNLELQSWFRGESPPPQLLVSESGPVWTRLYSQPPVSPAACATLERALRALRVKRMVVGHTVHKQVSSACADQVWRIDVGMAAHYGGTHVQALEIMGAQVRTLSAEKRRLAAE